MCFASVSRFSITKDLYRGLIMLNCYKFSHSKPLVDNKINDGLKRRGKSVSPLRTLYVDNNSSNELFPPLFLTAGSMAIDNYSKSIKMVASDPSTELSQASYKIAHNPYNINQKPEYLTDSKQNQRMKSSNLLESRELKKQLDALHQELLVEKKKRKEFELIVEKMKISPTENIKNINEIIKEKQLLKEANGTLQKKYDDIKKYVQEVLNKMKILQTENEELTASLDIEKNEKETKLNQIQQELCYEKEQIDKLSVSYQKMRIEQSKSFESKESQTNDDFISEINSIKSKNEVLESELTLASDCSKRIIEENQQMENQLTNLKQKSSILQQKNTILEKCVQELKETIKTTKLLSDESVKLLKMTNIKRQISNKEVCHREIQCCTDTDNKGRDGNVVYKKDNIHKENSQLKKLAKGLYELLNGYKIKLHELNGLNRNQEIILQSQKSSLQNAEKRVFLAEEESNNIRRKCNDLQEQLQLLYKSNTELERFFASIDITDPHVDYTKVENKSNIDTQSYKPTHFGKEKSKRNLLPNDSLIEKKLDDSQHYIPKSLEQQILFNETSDVCSDQEISSTQYHTTSDAEFENECETLNPFYREQKYIIRLGCQKNIFSTGSSITKK